MFIEEVLNLSGMVFKPQNELKPAKYKKLKIWNTGWETIDIGTPPTGNKVVQEIKFIQKEVKGATDEQKEQYINCDLDASYYIKQYMDDNDLEYSDDIIEMLEDQCRPIVRHYKNFYNRPRPYQVAEKLGIPFERFKTKHKQNSSISKWTYSTTICCCSIFCKTISTTQSRSYKWCKNLWLWSGHRRITLPI